MRVAHFDCFSGISGDMTLGALIGAGVDERAIRAALDSLGLPVTLTVTQEQRRGFACTRAKVDAPHEHAHRHLPDVEKIIDAGALTPAQNGLAKRIFRRLAEAEAAAHGIAVEKVHFHEVGALDSIADIVGSAVGLDLLGVERFTCGPVPTGRGFVTAAHGRMPVPAPGTAALLKNVPLADSPVAAELTTPTGAAILTTVVSEFTERPPMTVTSVGTGAGSKDFAEQPNVLRIFVGEAAVSASGDRVWVLETNLDDVPAEVIGYAVERLFAAGALDVFAVPIQMKKQRPGVLLTVIADDATAGELEAILFRETGTFGVRRARAERTKRDREMIELTTPWGPVRAKRGAIGGDVIVTPEYEDCARVARENGVPLREVYACISSAMGKEKFS